MEFSAELFDGTSTKPNAVRLTLSSEGLQVQILNSGEAYTFPYFEIQKPEQSGLGFRYTLRNPVSPTQTSWALHLSDPAGNAELKRCLAESSGQGKRFLASIGRLPIWKLLLLTLLGLGLFFTLIFTGLQYAYRLTPIAYDLHLGRQVDSAFSKFYEPCHSPELDSFFQKSLTRLALPNDRFPHKILVLNDSTVNALALPGGTIYVFRGLLEKSSNPDELLGVISHELSHSELRHTVRQIIQSTGVSYLITLTVGLAIDGMDMLERLESTLEMSSILLTLRYSRTFESEADSLGIIRMHHAKLKVGPLDTLLTKISPKPRTYDRILSWFSSHPLSRERSIRFSQAQTQESFTQDTVFAATRLNWNTIKNSCPVPQDSLPLWKKILK